MSAGYEQSENERFKKVFRLWVGSDGYAPDDKPKMTVEELANLSGIAFNTVKGHHRHDGSMPNWANLQLYMKCLPVGFADSMLFGCGFHVVEAEEHDSQDSHGLMADLAGNLSTIADDLRDGNHSDDEKFSAAPGLIKLGADCTMLGHEWLQLKPPSQIKIVA